MVRCTTAVYVATHKSQAKFRMVSQPIANSRAACPLANSNVGTPVEFRHCRSYNQHSTALSANRALLQGREHCVLSADLKKLTDFDGRCHENTSLARSCDREASGQRAEDRIRNRDSGERGR